MKKLILASLFLGLLSNAVLAQSPSLPIEATKKALFGSMDVSLTAGTTGLGLEVSSPISSVFTLRAGYSFMPHINFNMNFGVGTYISKEDGTVEETSKFDKLSGFLKDFTGYEADDNVQMKGHPTYHNLSVLLDITPLRNKHWHLTAGFYYGNASIGKAVNAIEDMPSLFSVNMYNSIYDKIENGDPIYTTNGSDVYLDPELEQKFLGYGRMAVYMGDFKENGKPYMMLPDANSMVSATVKVNKFKPYIGFGYGGRLLKDNDKYHISFDCGLMFWGGTPSVITHDGVDLAKDLVNVRGKVGDYVSTLKKFTAFPVLNVKISRTIF